ncbi:virulence-associated E family protein [Lyngbya aestuarii BL J]|uniref:Virulence-associated E family protein n=1 Tax=Lyngbya aestuarii BL J TaxID=1348334 RepID=U7QLA3_9CYAN|nr:VapE domain-containing protein [Lyngbya aestuarii]ERT07201.1 virulence-associated E family protein [Lyngbya aestuarii BL J]
MVMIASEQLKHATKDNPCPHCGKTDWCYSLGDLTVCKRGFDPATGWIRTSKTDKEGDHFYAIERPDSSFTRNGYSSRPSSPPKPPTIELARLPQQPKPLQSEAKGSKVITTYPYGPEHQIKRVEAFEGGQRTGKQIYQYHLEDDKMVPGKGDLPWNAYRIDEAIRYGKGKGVLIVEGEKCVEAARQNQIAAITWQGSNWTVDQMTADLLKLKIAGVSFVAHEYDHDDAGTKKAEKIVEAGKRADFPIYLIDPVELWSEMPEKGDIADWVEQVELTPDQRVKQLQKTAKLQTPQQPETQPVSPQVKRAKDNKAIKIEMERDRARQIIGNQLRFNERSKELELFIEDLGVQGERFELDFLESNLSKHFGITIDTKDKTAEGIVRGIAEENGYDPVRDYLEQCAQQHSDTSILDNLAEVLFGASEPIAQAMLKKTLIAGVARTYDPGCKCDTATVLYSPKQGIGKSTTWKTLFGEEHYCEDVGDISNKDEVTKMRRGWGCELSEIARITRKKDADKVKQFLSTSIDWMRDPYGRSLQKNKRRGIIVGTTNSDDFLQDRTGNRRFEVIEVQKPVDIKWLAKHRDQIWAAAVHLYKQGKTWWLTREEEGQSRDINQGFMDALPFEDEILEIVSGKDKAATQQIVDSLVQRHGIKADTSRDRKDLELTIKKVLQQNGWIKPKSGRVTIDGKQYRGYERLDSPQDNSKDKRQEPSRGVVYAETTISKESQSSLDGQTVKTDISQANKIPDTQPSSEPITKQIKDDLRDSLTFSKRVSEKEFFSRFPDHPDEVEAVIKQIENLGRIYRKAGYIYSLSPRKFKPGDEVFVTEGDHKSYWGVIERHNGLSPDQMHSYIVELDIGISKEPRIYYENQLRKA